MKMITVDVLVWYKDSKGEELFSSSERTMFEHDVQWCCKQFAQVNQGQCAIYYGEEKIADFDAR